MSSQARTREEERRFNVRTLVFASIGAAVAAILTSQFWIAGTPIAAAMTPVIVALVSEMLHRPTEKIAQKFTTETDALPESAGAARPPDEPGPPARDVTLYTREKRQLPWGKILATGAAAFLIGAAIVTLPELISGQSFGKGDGRTSILGNNRDRDRNSGNEEEAAPAEEQQQTVTETVPAEPPPATAPQSTTPRSPRRPRPTAADHADHPNHAERANSLTIGAFATYRGVKAPIDPLTQPQYPAGGAAITSTR